MGLVCGAIAATCAVAVAAVVDPGSADEPAAPSTRSGAAHAGAQIGNGTIAYSTAPANQQRPRVGGETGYLAGSDVYLASPGSEPRLVAGRRDGTTWNVCPAFSPGGKMLAFGTRSPNRRAIRVVGVTRQAAVVAPRRTLLVNGHGDAPCPRWSADGSRLAYLDGRRLVVRSLGGSIARPRAGDPSVADFRRNDTTLESPAKDRVARLEVCVVTVTRLDGSDARELDVLGCPYAVAGWSPDGRKLLVMTDISGFHFAMDAVPVDPPGRAELVAVARVNHPRSWPRYGDVSWQPTAP